MIKKSNLTCPYCGSHEIKRIARNRPLRSLPFSKKYECKKCLGEFFTLCKIITFRIGKPNYIMIKINKYNQVTNELKEKAKDA